MASYYTIRWHENGSELPVVSMIDQRLLPQEVVYREYSDAAGVAEAIRVMVIRGAPAIGVAAAYGLALAAVHSRAQDVASLLADLEQAAAVLHAARPTAVNLPWALKRVMAVARQSSLGSAEAVRSAVLAEAQAMEAEDVQTNIQMGLHGLAVIPVKVDGRPVGIVHHCNTGALATVDYGTALGVIRAAHEHGRSVHVYVDETRPRLQGARLTAWELGQLGIAHTLIVDGASGHFMRIGKVDLCLVGCDRIAANGDVANKVGTYNLALAAYAHGIPFYSVGPTSTIDFDIPDGAHIPIEERSSDEVTQVGECSIAPRGTQASNPAFDVTLAKYITGIITEKGIAYPPFTESLAKFK